MPIRFSVLLALFFALTLPARAFDAAEFWSEPQIPFDVTVLDQGRDRGRNAVEWRAFVFTSEIYGGVPMRIFAYYARPSAPGKYPAVVSLHGGIDAANRQRAIAFALSGYACLSFTWLPPDGNANNITNRTIYANLDYSDWGRRFSDLGPDYKRPIIYRAITASRRALTWLSQQEEVDASRLGVEGHSWGGYLAQLLAGVDNRVKAAVSSAAAGAWLRRYVEASHVAPPADFAPRSAVPPPLPQESVSGGPIADEYFTGASDAIYTGHRFNELSPWEMFEWSRRYDPAAYATNISAPILVRLGASDFFGSVDGLADYWNQISAPKALQLLPASNHGFYDVETRVDWFNHWLKAAPDALPTAKAGPYPHLTDWQLTPGAEGSWTVTVKSSGPRVVAGQVAWSSSPGASVTRQWAQRALVEKDGAWTATFAPQAGGGPLRVFVSLQDGAGHVSSTLPRVQMLPISTEVKPLTTQNKAELPIALAAVSPLEQSAAWDKATKIGPIALSPEMIGERSAHLKALWDKDALYLRVKVDDSTPWSPLKPNQPWWNGDSIHLRFRTGAADNQITHLVVFPAADGKAPGLIAFRGVAIRNQIWNVVNPVTARLEMEDAGYTIVLRVPWAWLDTAFAPATGASLRLSMLVNDSDLLTDEPILGADFNNAHALYKPDAWGMATLRE